MRLLIVVYTYYHYLTIPLITRCLFSVVVYGTMYALYCFLFTLALLLLVYFPLDMFLIVPLNNLWFEKDFWSDTLFFKIDAFRNTLIKSIIASSNGKFIMACFETNQLLRTLVVKFQYYFFYWVYWDSPNPCPPHIMLEVTIHSLSCPLNPIWICSKIFRRILSALFVHTLMKHLCNEKNGSL